MIVVTTEKITITMKQPPSDWSSFTMASPLMEQFVENAKYMPQEGEKEVSACQLECTVQQKSVVACVDSIRENGESNACLLPAVEAWTKCCTEANMAAAEDWMKDQGKTLITRPIAFPNDENDETLACAKALRTILSGEVLHPRLKFDGVLSSSTSPWRWRSCHSADSLYARIVLLYISTINLTHYSVYRLKNGTSSPGSHSATHQNSFFIFERTKQSGSDSPSWCLRFIDRLALMINISTNVIGSKRKKSQQLMRMTKIYLYWRSD